MKLTKEDMFCVFVAGVIIGFSLFALLQRLGILRCVH